MGVNARVPALSAKPEHAMELAGHKGRALYANSFLALLGGAAGRSQKAGIPVKPKPDFAETPQVSPDPASVESSRDRVGRQSDFRAGRRPAALSCPHGDLADAMRPVLGAQRQAGTVCDHCNPVPVRPPQMKRGREVGTGARRRRNRQRHPHEPQQDVTAGVRAKPQAPLSQTRYWPASVLLPRNVLAPPLIAYVYRPAAMSA